MGLGLDLGSTQPNSEWKKQEIHSHVGSHGVIQSHNKINYKKSIKKKESQK